MRHRPVWLVVSLLLLGACQSPSGSSPVPSASATPPTRVSPATAGSASRTPVAATLTRASTVENYRIEIAVFGAGGMTAIRPDVGSMVRLTIAFRPTKDVSTRSSNGSTTRYSETWVPGDGVEMRYCTAVGKPCTLPDQWMPFEKERYVDLTVNWAGVSSFQVVAQFRDAKGQIIPAGTMSSDSATQSMQIEGILNERTPVASQPPAIQTVIAQAHAAFPVTGSVQVGEGRAMGAKAGTIINIPVKFQASSAAGPVKEMRIKTIDMGRCLSPDEISESSWEPFVPLKTYPYRLGINWGTFKVHVQYRDAAGNLSPVYCSDIGVEGNP